jgi:BASS family bile acid:Na+ symporter
VWHNISGSVLSSWWRRHDDAYDIAADSQHGEHRSANREGLKEAAQV